MEWTIQSFVEARQATERLLEALGLGTYLFDVEPRDDGWEVRVEFPSEEGWKVTRLEVGREALERSLHEDPERERLLAAFRARLVGAVRSAPAQRADTG